MHPRNISGHRAPTDDVTEMSSLRDEIERMVEKGRPLHGVRLAYTDLKDIHLEAADLRGADLHEAQLQGAHLDRARLDGANLYNADLRGARLAGAKLAGACIDWADLRGTRGLRPIDCRPILPTVPGFRSVKRMFQESDHRDGASEFAFRETRQRRRDLGARHSEWFRSFQGLRIFGLWLTHCVLEVLCGYFERYLLPLLWSLLIILVCGGVYAVGNGIYSADVAVLDAVLSEEVATEVPREGISLREGIYFSTVTFTTLGYGDYRPHPGIWRLVAGAQAFTGAFLMSVFVVTLAHRYVVR